MSFQVVVIGLPGSGRTSFLKAIKNGRANEED
jgi:GTPase SAR1 family protein